MAIRQIRLPDLAGTPRLVIPETPTSAAPPLPDAVAPRPAAPPPPAPAPEIAPEIALPPAVRPRDPVEPPADPRAWYRSEAWLAVEFAALVPVLAALVAPPPYHLWLVALAGAMIALGLAMLVVRDRDARAARRRSPPP